MKELLKKSINKNINRRLIGVALIKFYRIGIKMGISYFSCNYTGQTDPQGVFLSR